MYILSRVTPKQLASLPGMSEPSKNAQDDGKKRRKKKADPECVGSNVYGVPESLLLKWIGFHYNRLGPAKPKRFTNFTDDLKDGSALCCVVQSHCPNFTQPGKPLQGFLRNPTDKSAAQANANKLLSSLKALGLDMAIEASQITEADPRDMLLIILYLYQNLPQFVPKTTIEFFGVLGTQIIKSIELRNPSKRPITYRVSLEGCDDFKISTNKITLEPGVIQSFPVEFVSRFSKTVTARLTFRAMRDGGGNAATMVFNLKSAVHSRKSLKTAVVETSCYEPVNLDVDIANPFAEDSTFQVTLLQDQLGDDGSEKAGGNVRTKKGRKGKRGKGNDNSAGSFPDPFWTKTQQMKIKAGQSSSINLQFLPFKEGKYRCQFVLLDDEVGEMMYEVRATANAPMSSEDFKFSVELASGVQRLLCLPARNAMLDRARHAAMERLAGPAKTKAREALKAYDSAERPPVKLDIEFNSPFFTGPNDIVVHDTKKSDKPGISTPRGAIDPNGNGLIFQFNPEDAGVYSCKVTLSNKMEKRIFNIEATVTAPGINKGIEFTAPARQSITQEIPIVNNSDKDWNLRAKIEGSNNFKGSAGITVRSGEKAAYTLSFNPEWVSEDKAKLTLNNPQTNEKFEFDLAGQGEEPLAEDHVEVEMKARESYVQKFTVVNKSAKSIEFAVESDLQYVSGASSINVKGKSKANYELTINPLLAGTYSGQITFTSPDGKFQWYTVEINADSAPPEQTLELSSFVRKAVSVEIGLENPLNTPVAFEVTIQGQGLLGEKMFSLKAGEAGVYELLYSPLLPGRSSGSVVFSSEDIGEVWYGLLLTAENAPPVELKEMITGVGNKTKQEIELENPCGEEISLRGASSNRRNFTLIPSVVTIAPYSTAKAVVEYTPSSLTEIEKSMLTFNHPQLGNWTFLVSGSGTPPSAMDPIEVSTPINVRLSTSFNFRNPFPSPLDVNVVMKASEEKPDSAGLEPVFDLMLKRKICRVAPFGILQVPFVFNPTEIEERHCVVEVTKAEGEDTLVWNFPICGIAEAPPLDSSRSFTCRARTKLEDTLEVALRGLDEVAPGETFSYELLIPEDMRGLVERSLTITPIVESVTSVSEPLQYSLLFQPLRPFNASIEFIVNKASGGRWRQEIVLAAEEPEIDDVIVMEAMLNHTSSVSFKLTNQFNTYAKFTAAFSPDTPYDFSVYPSEGTLEPYGREGTNFIISFTPTEYGKTLTGKLVILTEEMQWTYEVQGTHPEYKAPSGTSKVVSHLPQGTQKALKKAVAKKTKNYMKSNMKNVRNKRQTRR
jgi:hypothetical protein